MLGTSSLMAFIATRNPARARAFYADVLGLDLKRDEPWALVFDAHGTMLCVQTVQELPPLKHTVVGWSVPNISAAIGALRSKGLAFERYEFLPQDALGVWTTPDGAKVAWFKDPDGNTLSLTQFPGNPATAS